MTDTLFNTCMALFGVVMIAVWASKPIHTGLLGSLGCVTMAIASLVSIDDSLFSSVESIQWTIVTFIVGALLCVAHLVVRIARAKIRDGVPVNVPHRRATDAGEFYDRPHHDSR